MVYCTSHIASVGRRFETVLQIAQLHIVYCTQCTLCIAHHTLTLAGGRFETASQCITVHHSASQCITGPIKSSWSISGLCAALINQKCLIFWSCWKRVMCQNDCKEIFCGLQELSLINKCLHGVEREIFWWWKEGSSNWNKKHADTNTRSSLST